MVRAWILVPMCLLSACLTLGGATALRLEIQSMLWVLHPGAVIGTQTNVQEPMKSMVWRPKKDQLDVTMGRILPDRQWSKRGRRIREYALNEFWHTFVDDRPLLGEASITETNTQSKAVFSYAMTVACCVMDRNPLRITWSGGSYPLWKAFVGSAKKPSKYMSGCQYSPFPCRTMKFWWL